MISIIIIIITSFICYIYAFSCIFAKSYLEKRYSKIYDDFILYVHLDLQIITSLRYPIQILLRRKYDMEYKYLYLTEKINSKRFFRSNYEELIMLKKELNKIERKMKLKKIR